MARRVPFRMPAVRFSINAKDMLAEIDKTLVEFTNPEIIAQIVNTASTRRKGSEISLFVLLDRGSRPHSIGTPSDVLVNKEEDFGPVRGPVQHPGTEPHDISGRVTLFFTEKFRQNFFGPSTRSLVNRRTNLISMRLIHQVMTNILLQTTKFAENITPSNWQLVKRSYVAMLNGRRI